MPTPASDPLPVPQAKRAALLRVLAATRTLAAQVTFYAAAFGAVALLGGTTLPPELQFFAGAVGANILTSIIERLAKGEDVPDDEIRQQVEAAIAQSDIAGALQDHETQAMIGRLFSRMHLLHYALATGQDEIAERLETQAKQYEALFAELQGTVDRIDETTTRTDASVQVLLERVQPSVDPAQRLQAALDLLDRLPLKDIPDIAHSLPAGSRMFFKPNRLFVGRQDGLRMLAATLKGGATAAVGQIAAATGLGGIGKTQLAVEFVHRYGQFFAGGVFWLSCANPDAVPAEVVECGRSMALPGFDALEFPDQVRRVQQAWQEPLPRLLVFDNCEDEDLLDRWRPASGGCRVLVTSRRGSWSAGMGVHALALGVLERPESVALLRRFRPDLAEDDKDLHAIAGELGDLPLALHLAGSYLQRYRYEVTPGAYLDQLRRPGLLAHRSLVTGDRSPTGHEQHVERTFALSFGRLDGADQVDALAVALLARLAQFAPGEPVPRRLLLLTLEPARQDSPPAKLLQSLKRLFQRQSLTARIPAELETSDALERLDQLGLVSIEATGDAVLHRLLAAFVLDLPEAEQVQATVEQALLWEANRLNKAGIPGPLMAWQAHLRYLADRAAPRRDKRAAGLCNELGYHLKMIGDLAGARPYYEQALAITRQVLGEQHPDTAGRLSNLGGLLYAQGDLAGAQPYLEQALAIYYRALGEQHPLTALSLNNLGMLLKDQGDLDGARPYYEQALAIHRQVLGEQHPLTAGSLNNLGMLLKDQGDLAGAQPYLEQALAIYYQALGEQHPDTATSLNNLGTLLKDQGDLAGARSYYERALAIRRQVMGEQHPDTATSLNNLGALLQDEGDLSGAKPYLEQALAVSRQVLGEQHPLTATSLNNLGRLLQDQGDLAGAKLYFEQALAILQHALGPGHPNTVAVRNNLARLNSLMDSKPRSLLGSLSKLFKRSRDS